MVHLYCQTESLLPVAYFPPSECHFKSTSLSHISHIAVASSLALPNLQKKAMKKKAAKSLESFISQMDRQDFQLWVVYLQVGQKEEMLMESKILHDFIVTKSVLFYIKVSGSLWLSQLRKKLGHKFQFNFLWELKLCTDVIFLPKTSLQCQ